jgi:hypothetical protein
MFFSKNILPDGKNWPQKKLGGVSIYSIHKKTYPKRKIQQIEDSCLGLVTWGTKKL